MSGSTKSGDRIGNITGGAIMVTLGLLFMSGQMGLAEFGILWRYWPAVLIVIGLAHLLFGEGGDRYGNGFMHLFLGIAILAINLHWMDLGWGSGWPLVLVAIGAAIVMRALLTPPTQRKPRPDSGAEVVEEERHV